MTDEALLADLRRGWSAVDPGPPEVIDAAAALAHARTGTNPEWLAGYDAFTTAYLQRTEETR